MFISFQNKNLLLEFAEELAYTCYLTFARQPTHLAPEITYFNMAPDSPADFYVKSNDAHYLLRPETIESLWYLYYVTGNKTYQDWGWNIFQVKQILTLCRSLLLDNDGIFSVVIFP
jgi:hypothetical protein